MENIKVDTKNLRRVILGTADQFAQGQNIAKGIVVDKQFSRVVVSGMGGSALHADVLRIYINDFFKQDAEYQKMEIYQNRFYELPSEAYEDCLNIICSHSGNTEETVSSFKEALVHNLPCVGISAGGIIEEMCIKNNIPYVKLPIPFEDFQPRMATGHFLSVIVQILVNAGKLPSTAIETDDVAKKLNENIALMEEQGKNIANRLVGKTPVVYASNKFKGLAMVWKIKINENAKTPAFWNYFPELNHNEFVGFTNSQTQFYVLMLRDAEDHSRNLLRYDVSARFLEKKGVETEIVDMSEGDILYRIFSTIALADWVSYYLALAYNQDPTPVDMVEDFKKALN